jgi:WD40 repeat protein
MNAPDQMLSDPRLKDVLVRRSVGSHTSGELVGDVMRAVRSVPQGRRSRFESARFRPLVAALVGTALLVGGLIGGALVGGWITSDVPLSEGGIVYTSGTWGWDGSPTITGHAFFSLGSAGGEPRRLIDVPGEPRPDVVDDRPAGHVRLGPPMLWSPDGTRIAFRLYEDQAGLYVMNRDGTGLRRVAEATGEPGDATDPYTSSFAWSPDGSRIAFISPDVMPWPPDRPRNGRLLVVFVDSLVVRELNESAAGSVAWSPDGSTIAFGRSRGASSELVLITSGGTGERSFVPPDTGRNHVGAITWSPDGSRLAFAEERFSGTREGTALMVVSADFTGPREVAFFQAGCCSHGAFGGLVEWSPDGTLIATRTRPDTIAVFAADGSGERLTIPGYYVDWSPDGSQLVLSGPGASFPGAPQGFVRAAIYVIDSDGTDQRWLADGDYPAWSP